jgi:hypothetical protein
VSVHNTTVSTERLLWLQVTAGLDPDPDPRVAARRDR